MTSIFPHSHFTIRWVSLPDGSRVLEQKIYDGPMPVWAPVPLVDAPSSAPLIELQSTDE